LLEDFVFGSCQVDVNIAIMRLKAGFIEFSSMAHHEKIDLFETSCNVIFN